MIKIKNLEVKSYLYLIITTRFFPQALKFCDCIGLFIVKFTIFLFLILLAIFTYGHYLFSAKQFKLEDHQNSGLIMD